MQLEQNLQRQSKWSEIASAVEMQCRVIMAVILRETKTRYGTHKLGFLWIMLEPALFIAGFAAIRAVLGFQAPHGMSNEMFMLSGMIPFLLFRSTMTQVTLAIRANKPLLAFPQVTTFDLIVARAILEFATMVSVFLILLIILLSLGIEADIEFPLQFFCACVLLFLAGLGLGTFLGCLMPFMPSIQQVVKHVLNRPLFFTSGIFFTADQVPEGIREILLINPCLHLVEFARSAFFKSFESEYVDLQYAVSFCLILLALGFITHRAIHKKAQVL